MPEQTKKALIVGAGPVGTLTALSLHKRGWKVEIWEGRPGLFCPHDSPENKETLTFVWRLNRP